MYLQFSPMNVKYLLIFSQLVAIVIASSTNNSQFQSISWPFKAQFAQFLSEMCVQTDLPISESCRGRLINFADDLKNNDESALKTFDSFARLKPGLLSSRLTDFGDYEQCLEKTSKSSRYVVLEVDIDKNELYHLSSEVQRHIAFQKPIVAICVPKACNESDVTNFLSIESVVSIIYPFKLTVFTSESIDEDAFHHHQALRYISRGIIVIIISLSLIATVYCRLYPLKDEKMSQVVKCFDLVKNCQAIFEQSRPEQARTHFFNSYRAMYLLCAIQGHILVPMSPAIRPYHHSIIDTFLGKDVFTVKMMQLYSYVIAPNFLLSSSLSVITWMPIFHSKQGNISFIAFIFARLCRMYPVVISYMLLVASFPWRSSLGGPLMNYMQNTSIHLLRNYGWRDLLFISNFQHPNNLAIPVAWFTACDMQLYIASFIIIYYLYKQPRVGIYLAIIQLILGLIGHCMYLAYTGVSPTSFVASKRFDNAEQILHSTHLHTINYVGPYSIGLLFGFLLSQDIHLPRQYHKHLLIVSVSVFIITGSLPAILYDDEGHTNYPRYVELLFGTIYKPMMVTALVGMLYFCWLNPQINYLPRLNHCFAILSRLSFCMFLVHPIQILFHMSASKDARQFDPTDINMFSLYITVTCFFYGLLMHVFAEAPFYRLTRLLSASKSPDRSHSSQLLSKSAKSRFKKSIQ